MATDRRFTGQREETAIGLYDYAHHTTMGPARYYDPVLGRFIQADTIVPEPGNPQSLNRYAYVYNNPLRYTDPSGHYSEDEIMEAFGVSSWEEVLAFFKKGSGEYLENRWGWLEILRRGEDGDVIFSNPWEQVSDSYAQLYQLHRNDEGQILVGDIDHAYFANHQTQYMLISGNPLTTPYSKIHRHRLFEIFEYSKADAEAAILDVTSIAIEVFGSGLGGSFLQAVVDAFGTYGAGQTFGKTIYPKIYGPTISSDDLLGISSAVPVIGIGMDVIDIGVHAFGLRVVYTP
jgi:RHS repeat-associated protein